MKKLTSLFLALLLVTLPLTANAAENKAEEVRALIDALPTVEQFQTMDQDAQLEAYNRTQAAYDAYEALSEEEKAGIAGAEATFEALFGHFNTLVAPLGEAEAAPPETEPEGTSEPFPTWLTAVIFCLAALTMVFRRRRQ